MTLWEKKSYVQFVAVARSNIGLSGGMHTLTENAQVFQVSLQMKEKPFLRTNSVIFFAE
jgi:hypothetical protein